MMPDRRCGQCALPIVLLVLVLSLAFPLPARADNCFGELGECAKKAFMSNLAMIGAALAAIGYLASPQGPLGGAAPPTLGELRQLAKNVAKQFEGEPAPPEYGDPTDKPPDHRDSAPHGGLGPDHNIQR